MKDNNEEEDWMQLVTGKAFYVLDPTSEAIDIEDIAHSLSNKCRFGGHCRELYSVAQHSVHVSHHCAPEDALWGLLHDASEAYLPDVVKPVKPVLEGFKRIEMDILRCVATRFDLPWHSLHGFPVGVKDIDDRILIDEREQLMPKPEMWKHRGEPLGIRIEPWEPKRAKIMFLHRFNELRRKK